LTPMMDKALPRSNQFHSVPGTSVRQNIARSWRPSPVPWPFTTGGAVALPSASMTIWTFTWETLTVSPRADLTPVYEMIFRRLKERRISWRYRFLEVGSVELASDKPDGARTLETLHREAELLSNLPKTDQSR
jgi:hypothetical protein